MLLSSTIAPRDFGLAKGATPVRKIKPRTGRKTMPGRFPSWKGTLPTLRTESRLELDGLGHFEINPRCVLLAAQPHRLEYEERTSFRGTTWRSYTPDLAIQMDDGGIVVVDFKVARYARLPKWREREALLRDCYARDHHVTFSVVTDEALSVEPRRTNVKIMLSRRPWHPDPEAEVAVRGAIAAIGLPSTVGAICAHAVLISTEI